MESSLFEVRTTALGNALFALVDFEPGDEIGIIQGQIINDPDYGSEYCIELDEHSSIEPHAPFRFLNHSCEPNCELVNWEFEDSPELQLSVHALRPIKAGSELTIDYAWPADAAISCLCGSASCRGWVVSHAELGQIAGKAATLPLS